MRWAIVEPPGETWSKKWRVTISRAYWPAACLSERCPRRRGRPRRVRSRLSRHSVAVRAWAPCAALGVRWAPGQAVAAEEVAGATARAAVVANAGRRNRSRRMAGSSKEGRRRERAPAAVRRGNVPRRFLLQFSAGAAGVLDASWTPSGRLF